MGLKSEDVSKVVSAQHPPSWQLTTKITVSGVRFLRNRLQDAIVRRNTAQWDNPIRFYNRAHTWSVIAVAGISAACVLLAWLRPGGLAGAERILRDSSSGELYVVTDTTLRPVLNLTSARLITGQHSTPRAVRSREISKHSRGQMAGIPGAPYDTPALSGSDSFWSVCDTIERPTSLHPGLAVSVLADKLTYSPDTAAPLGPRSVLARYSDQTYLVDESGRHALDVANTAITTAINLPSDAAVTPLSEAVFNALPASDALGLPPIPQNGAPNTVGLDPSITIGTVIVDSAAASKQFYVVLPDGAAKINPATARALRNTNTWGHVDPPIVAADRIAKLPSRTYPSPLHDVTLVDRKAEPVLCWAWSKTGDKTAAPQTLVIAGRQVPLTHTQLATGVQQVTTGITVYETGAGRHSDEPTGRFVRIINPAGKPENRFYIDQAGVRYGLPDTAAEKALGLFSPQLAPWPVARLLAAGPDLTQANALLEHDTLPPDPTPREISNK